MFEFDLFFVVLTLVLAYLIGELIYVTLAAKISIRGPACDQYTLMSPINVQCSVRLFNFLKKSTLYAHIRDLHAY